jgi:hypothetical protein
MAQKYEQVSQKLPLHKIIFNNFIGGIAWGIGATVGLSIFFTILGIIGQQINLVPIVGTFISHIIDFILTTNPHLK